MINKFKACVIRLKGMIDAFIQSEHPSYRAIGYKKFLTVGIIVIIFLLPSYSFALGLLAHEAVIDRTWEKSIKPLLKIKYPRTTDSALQVAHSYAYGGAVIPDMGYYPLGSIFYTHLLHYVYTGDFINALINEAQNVNEYAFALGVLSHYYADIYGHPLCTNRAVPILFPELKPKFGDVITYEQAEEPHSRVEYGFDVIQTAIGNYKSEEFHSIIGFQVSQPVLERAFLKTYKLKINDIFTSLPVAIEVYRFS
ncbi:MAG: zinc dependent phospholipase C family protein, partial [Bacteroidota bacterium]